MTFSIVARSTDPATFGMAIASSSPAVAARCSHARAGIGVVASQNITDPSLGTHTLDALGRGLNPSAALAEVLAATPFAEYRQVLAVGAIGAPAIHSGARALGVVGEAVGLHAAAAGNLLAHADVPAAMLAAFEAARGHLGARLLAALEAGLARGGEAGPIHSAGLLVVRDVAWPIVDLRVDWAEREPLDSLHALWDIYAAQIDAYVRRALDPRDAPSYGVPGDP
jgi:uncharacterized Ntn-hydrolase superfamily protein